MSRRKSKEVVQLSTIIHELDEQTIDPEEIELLADKLPRFTAVEPSIHETKAFIERLRPHIKHESSMKSTLYEKLPAVRFSALLEQRELSERRAWPRMKPYLLPQAQLLAWQFWLISALVVLLGGVMFNLMADDVLQNIFEAKWHTHPLILLIPLLTGLSLSYSFRSYGTPMYELELTFPITPAQWLLSKMTLIVLYDILLATAASFIYYAMIPVSSIASYSLFPFIISWLVPLCLYCAGSVACMLRFGTLIGSLVMAAIWFVQMSLMSKLGPFYFLSDPSYEFWQESKWFALLLTLLFTVVVLLNLRTKSGMKNGMLRETRR